MKFRIPVISIVVLASSCDPAQPRTVDRCEGVDCSGHGTCAAGVCQCEPGYEGPSCSTCSDGYVADKGVCLVGADACENVDCSSRGDCVAGSCVCNSGYGGPTCATCAIGYRRSGPDCVLPTDPCAGIDCSGHGSCAEGDCTCDAGYEGSVCGSCAAGYQPSGANCAPVDPCAGVDCSAHGSCANGACSCDPGYSGSNCSVCTSGCGHAWLDDQPTAERVTTTLNTNLGSSGFPRVSLGSLKTMPSAQQLSKYQLVAGKPFSFRGFAAAQAVNSGLSVYRILCPQEYQGWPEADPCRQGSGLPFSSTGPATAACQVFAGHWLYEAGTTLKSSITATATTLSVTDASRIRGGIHAVIYSGGPGAFENPEHVMVSSVNKAANTVTLSKRGFKSVAQHHPANAIVASHVRGNGDDFEPQNWVYNLSTRCPVDASGRRFNRVLAEWLAANYDRDAQGKRVAGLRVDGVLYDSDFQYVRDGNWDRKADVNNDLAIDYGFSSAGVNWWGEGLDEFYLRVRDGLPNNVLTMGGDSKTFGYSALNGVQMEGYPSKILPAGHAPDYSWINRLNGMANNQVRLGAYGPRITDFHSKVPTALYPQGARQGYEPTSNAVFRLGLGMALMYGAHYSFQNFAVVDPWYDEYAVDVRAGSSTFGHAVASNPTDETALRAHLGWMGQPLGPYRREYDPDAYSAANNMFPNGGFESALSASWDKKNVTFERVNNQARAGSSSLHISEQQPYANSIEAAYVRGPSINLTAGKQYTLALSVRSPVPRAVRVYVGSHAQTMYVGDGWSRQIYAFKATTTGTHRFQLRCGLNQSELWLDEIYLHAGNANVFRRDFEHAVVIANATPSARTVALGGTLKRIKGTGQDAINDGATVTSVTIGAWDAAFLVRPR